MYSPCNKQTRGNNENCADLLILGITGRTNSTVNNEPNTLPQPSENKRPPPPKPLHKPQAGERTHGVHGTKDNLRNKRIGNSHRLKHRRAVVKEEVSPRQLLEALQQHAQHGAVKRLFPHLERLVPLCLWHVPLGHDHGEDLVELAVDKLAVVAVALARDEAQRLDGVLVAVLGHEPARGFGEEEHAREERGGPEV